MLISSHLISEAERRASYYLQVGLLMRGKIIPNYCEAKYFNIYISETLILIYFFTGPLAQILFTFPNIPRATYWGKLAPVQVLASPGVCFRVTEMLPVPLLCCLRLISTEIDTFMLHSKNRVSSVGFTREVKKFWSVYTVCVHSPFFLCWEQPEVYLEKLIYLFFFFSTRYWTLWD